MKSTLANIQNKVAHSATLGTRVSIGGAAGSADTKHLAECIVAEKLCVSSARSQARDTVRCAEAYKAMGLSEGDDLGDVAACSLSLMDSCATAYNRYADHHDSIRGLLKGIRTREEELEELRKKRKATVTRLDAHEKKIAKTKVDSPALMNMHQQRASMQSELSGLNDVILRSEAQLSDFKRCTMKSIMNLQFGGMMELAESMTVVAAFGLALAEHIPLETTLPGQSRPAYTSFEATARELEEARLKLQDVVFQPRTSELSQNIGGNNEGEFDDGRSLVQTETTAGQDANNSYDSADFNPVRSSSDAWRDAPSISTKAATSDYKDYQHSADQPHQQESTLYDAYDGDHQSGQVSQPYSVGGQDQANLRNLPTYSAPADSPVTPGFHAESGESQSASEAWVSVPTDYHGQLDHTDNNKASYNQSTESQMAGLPPGAASARYARLNSNMTATTAAPLSMPTPAIRMPSPQMNGMPTFPGYNYDSTQNYPVQSENSNNVAGRTLPASAFRRKPQSSSGTTNPLVVRKPESSGDQGWDEPDSPT